MERLGAGTTVFQRGGCFCRDLAPDRLFWGLYLHLPGTDALEWTRVLAVPGAALRKKSEIDVLTTRATAP
jgi:hypothetical protein